MNLLTSACGVIAALAILGTATGQDIDEAKKDLDKMQGVWRVVSWQMADEKNVVDPKGPRQGTFRVLRGGSWVTYPENCRSAFRETYKPGCPNLHVGFRLCFCLD